MIREIEYEDAYIRRWALWSDDRTRRLGTDTEDISSATVTEGRHQSRVDLAIAELETIATGTGSLTTAELTLIVRKMAGTIAALARLYLRRF